MTAGMPSMKVKNIRYYYSLITLLLNLEKLRESFDSHPEFYFPINGYSMEISNPPQDGELLHNFVDCLHKQLKSEGNKNITRRTLAINNMPIECLPKRFSFFMFFHSFFPLS